MAELVGDFLLKRLREWGINRIYGYPGDGINGILGAVNRADSDPSSSRCAMRRWRRSWRAATRSSPANRACASPRPGPVPSTCSTGSTTPSSTTSPWWPSSASRRRGARRLLPAGDRPGRALQGRRAASTSRPRPSPSRCATSSTAPSASRKAERTVTCIIVPNDVQSGAVDDAAARARHGPLRRRLQRAAGDPSEADRRAAEILNCR